MSTGIEIKKRIAAKEEGVTITNDLSSINFVGAGATAAVVGDEVTVTVPGSIGATAYYLNQTVTQSPYKEFTSVPTTAAEQDTATTIASGATAVIGAYQTPAGVPNTTSIPAGLWQFFLHLYSNVASDDWDVYVEVYKRDLGGIETLLFNTDIEAVTNMSTSTTMYLLDGVFPTTSLLTTDRIVVKVLATNMGSGSQTIHMVTEGSAHYSVGTTTLNQVVGSGSVTAVTGTAPIASSGGTTPAISISQSTTSTNGYLSSTDWNTFNNKVDKNIYSADGTVVSDRQVNLNGKNLSFTNGSSVGNFTTLLDDGVQLSQLTVDWGQILLDVQGGGSGHNLLIQPTGVTVGGYYRLPNTAPSVGQVLKCTSAGITSWGTDSGLTYFTEAQNTAAPNATVNVDSLTAVASTANADFAIVSKGNGSIMFGVPNNATSGGNKRGLNSVDLQKYRTAADQVVGGDASSQVGAENKTVGAFSGTYGNSNANNVNYTHVLGRSNTANGASSILVGQFNSNSGTSCGAFGHNNSLANDNQYALGAYNSLGNQSSIAIGRSCTDNGTNGRIVIGISAFVAGDTQKSIFSLSKRTTDATQTSLTLAASAYQGATSVRIADNSAYRFKGTIIGKQSGSTNAAAWDIDGLIVRGVGAATTSLSISNINLVQNSPAWGTPVLSADTTQGCLKVDVIGKVATNIQWTAMIETTEVIYA